MRVGLLWYDADVKKPSESKVEEAAQRYRDKFGVDPDTCHVNPSDEVRHEAIHIIPNRWIRPGYYWIGVDDEAPDFREPDPAAYPCRLGA